MGKDRIININVNNSKSRLINFSKIKAILSDYAKSDGILESEMLEKVINYIQNYRKDGYVKPEDLDFLVFNEGSNMGRVNSKVLP